MLRFAATRRRAPTNGATRAHKSPSEMVAFHDLQPELDDAKRRGYPLYRAGRRWIWYRTRKPKKQTVLMSSISEGNAFTVGVVVWNKGLHAIYSTKCRRTRAAASNISYVQCWPTSAQLSKQSFVKAYYSSSRFFLT